MYTSTLPRGPRLVQLTLDFQGHVGDSHFKGKCNGSGNFFRWGKIMMKWWVFFPHREMYSCPQHPCLKSLVWNHIKVHIQSNSITRGCQGHSPSQGTVPPGACRELWTDAIWWDYGSALAHDSIHINPMSLLQIPTHTIIKYEDDHNHHCTRLK